MANNHEKRLKLVIVADRVTTGRRGQMLKRSKVHKKERKEDGREEGVAMTDFRNRTGAPSPRGGGECLFSSGKHQDKLNSI